MPLYEYECEVCGHRFESIQKFSDAPLEQCPRCGGAVHKLQSAPAFQFKGTGWYVTDYAKKEQTPAGKAEGSGDAASAGKAEAKGDKGEKGEKSERAEKTDKTEKSEKKTEKAEKASEGPKPEGSSLKKAD